MIRHGPGGTTLAMVLMLALTTELALAQNIIAYPARGQSQQQQGARPLRLL